MSLETPYTKAGKLRKTTRKLVARLFKQDNAPIQLTDGQCDIFNAINDSGIQRLQIETPTRYGKSLVVALAVIYYRYTKGGNIVIIAPKREQAQIIMDYVNTHLYDQPFFLEGLNVDSSQRLKTKRRADRLVWEDGSGIRILSANASNMNASGLGVMGFGAGLLITDESALIPDKIYSKIIRMLGDDVQNSKLVKIGNPFNRNHFYRTHDEYELIWLNYAQAIREKRLSVEFIAEMRREMPAEDFTVMYEVKFPEASVSNQIIPDRLVDIHEVDFNPEVLVAGLDVAGVGSDESILTILETDYESYKVVEQVKIAQDSVIDQAKEVDDIMKTKDVQAIAVDTVGIGAGLYDYLIEISPDYEVISYMAGSRATKPNYANIKTELLFNLRKLLEEKKVGFDGASGKLLENLVQYTKIRSGKTIRSVDPDDSPDWGDSLLASFYASTQYSDLTIEFF